MFVIDLIVCNILYGRMYQHYRMGAGNRVVLFLDEADSLIARRDETIFEGGLSPLVQVFKHGRAYEIMGVIAVSCIGGISRYISSNAQYQIALNLADDESVTEAAKTMMIPPGSQGVFASRKIGQCVARHLGSWSKPFLVNLDYAPTLPATGRPTFDSFPYIPAKSLDELPPVLEALEQLKAQHKNTTTRQKTAHTDKVANSIQDLLHGVSIHPFKPLAKHFEKLGITSGSTKTNLQRELKEKGLATFHKFTVGRRRCVFMGLTDAGWKAIGKTAPTGMGRGGIFHRYICHLIKLWAESQGYKATLEWKVNGTTHPVDVMIELATRIVVYEVCVECSDNLPGHLQACFVDSDAVDELVIVAATRKNIDKIKRALAKDSTFLAHTDHIRFETADSFLED